MSYYPARTLQLSVSFQGVLTGFRWSDDIWTMKYLSGFKWEMLGEQVGTYPLSNLLIIIYVVIFFLCSRFSDEY